MRPLEIALLLSLSLRILYPKRWNYFLPTIFLLLHLIFEGYRWQMIALYIFTALEVLITIRGFVSRAQKSIGRVRSWINPLIGIMILIVFAAAPVLFPIPKILAPTGPYSVGTTTLQWTDPSRADQYAPDPNSPREIVVQIWYPADAPGQTPSPWMEKPDIVAPAISTWIKMPAFFLDHLKYAATNSYQDISISSAEVSFPVLVFSHGFGGFRAQNTFQMQELASRGYIVVAPEHTYASVITVFPDGRVAYHNPNTLPDEVSETEYDLAAQRLVVQWTADLRFVLDILGKMNQSDPLFAGKLDLERVGVFGHSTGGGATVQLCAQDSRCKAGFGMDAWLVPVAEEVIADGPKQPFLFMYSEAWPKPKNMTLFRDLFDHMGTPVVHLSILGTSHYDFTDLPALSPLAPYIGLKGPLNGKRVQEIIDTYSLAFFDQTLKGIPAELLESTSPAFPEVLFIESR
jgi:predicted dienelactone hydrolase